MADSASAPMGFLQRAVGIFVSPARIFQELKDRPSWLAPLLTVSLISAGLNGLVLWTSTGEAAVREQFQETMQKRGQTLPPEVLDRQIQIYRYAGPVSYLVVTPIFALLIGGLIYLIFSIGMGGEGTFRQTFAAYTHVGLIGIAWFVVTIGLIFLKGSLKSSTAFSAFLPFLEESTLAYKILRGLDIFIIWQLAVLAIGLGILNNQTTKKAATVLFSLYLGIVLVVAVIWQMMA
jgi:hypothetical protein